MSKLSGLRTSRVTFDSVRVDWTLVPELFIFGYRVLVQNTSFNKLVAWNKSFTDITGLHSNFTYVIKVYPVHGLTDKWSSAASSQNITVTTKTEKGKQFIANNIHQIAITLSYKISIFTENKTREIVRKLKTVHF